LLVLHQRRAGTAQIKLAPASGGIWFSLDGKADFYKPHKYFAVRCPAVVLLLLPLLYFAIGHCLQDRFDFTL
jgi:hypothetical protein